MKYENDALFLKSHAGGDDKLWINLAWPNMQSMSYIIVWHWLQLGNKVIKGG